MKLPQLFFITFIGLAAEGFAQDVRLEQEQLHKSPEGLIQGWNKYLIFNLGVNANSQKDVVSSQDGQSTTWNLKIEANSTWLSGSNEWRNELLSNVTLTRTPLIPEYYKSDDFLRFSSLYLWHVPGVENIGPFARLSLNTAVMPGHDVRPETVTYSIASTDPAADIETRTTDRLKLTDAFSPFILKETLGAFYYPYRSDLLAVEALLGFGARQTYAKNQLVVADDSSTPNIEVGRLQDRRETGIDSKLSAFGQINERLSYKAEAGMFVPLTRSDESQDDKDKSNMEKRSWETLANLSFKLLDWASLEYMHRLQRDYSLSEKVQRTSTLLFNVAYVLGNVPKADQE